MSCRPTKLIRTVWEAKRLDHDLVLPWSCVCSRSDPPTPDYTKTCWSAPPPPSHQTIQNVLHLTFLVRNQIITKNAFKIESCPLFGRRIKMMPLGEAWSNATSGSKNTESCDAGALVLGNVFPIYEDYKFVNILGSTSCAHHYAQQLWCPHSLLSSEDDCFLGCYAVQFGRIALMM